MFFPFIENTFFFFFENLILFFLNKIIFFLFLFFSIHLYLYCGRMCLVAFLSFSSSPTDSWFCLGAKVTSSQEGFKQVPAISFWFCLWFQHWNLDYSVLLNQRGKMQSVISYGKNILFFDKNRYRWREIPLAVFFFNGSVRKRFLELRQLPCNYEKRNNMLKM